MPNKWPDSEVRREIHEFNREFLGLVRAAPGPGGAYGLDPAVRRRLCELAPAQVKVVAETPVLLAAFTVLPARNVALGVAEGPLTRVGDEQSDAARLFAASLLAWLWHTARQDRLLAALCMGPGGLTVENLSAAGIGDLQRAAAVAPACLEARFCRHPRLWPDLVRAATVPSGPVQTATRLSVVQLTLISRH